MNISKASYNKKLPSASLTIPASLSPSNIFSFFYYLKFELCFKLFMYDMRFLNTQKQIKTF